MSKACFLWVDDEMELLMPYVLFLKEKGYVTEFAGNGHDALEMCRSRVYDIIFLDEHMPGLSGLETLERLDRVAPHVPVVMVTKSEDEGIMNQAIGKKIADYLIKPVNPHQVLLSIKKLLEKKELVVEDAAMRYQGELAQLDRKISEAYTANDWKSLYNELVYWELELEASRHPALEMLVTQKVEANLRFARFIRENYEQWIYGVAERPVMSPDIFKTYLFPMFDSGEKIFFILIDNFRLDQWRAIKDLLRDTFSCSEALYFSILPTATPYARNSLFSGLMPAQLSEKYPDLWIDESEDEGKNRMEEEYIRYHLHRSGRRVSFTYSKLSSNQEGTRLLSRFSELEDKDLNIMVFNFMDNLSHTRTESKMLKELVVDEAAYRSITRSWFLRSPLIPLLKKIADRGHKVIITTDHGAIRVKRGVKVIGDKETNHNLRYKLGRNLAYDPKQVYAIHHPKNVQLPAPNVSSRYIFAQNSDFLVYPNQFNQYISYYENSFQHGGISLEEMIIPFVTLTAK